MFSACRNQPNHSVKPDLRIAARCFGRLRPTIRASHFFKAKSLPDQVAVAAETVRPAKL
jgi:hypothetical protein